MKLNVTDNGILHRIHCMMITIQKKLNITCCHVKRRNNGTVRAFLRQTENGTVKGTEMPFSTSAIYFKNYRKTLRFGTDTVQNSVTVL